MAGDYKKNRVQLSHKLKLEFDSGFLEKDLKSILTHYQPKRQYDVYHDGGWMAIGLIALNGDPLEDRGLPGIYRKTPVLQYAPYIESILDSFPCEKMRVRLMQLMPRSHIYWHFDADERLDGNRIRLHIPIVTHPAVQFQLSHEDCYWRPGELWAGDFSFPHRLYNAWPKPRVHLVMDVFVNPFLLDLFDDNTSQKIQLRRQTREKCQWWWRQWFRYYSFKLDPNASIGRGLRKIKKYFTYDKRMIE